MGRPFTITNVGLKELQGRMRRLEVALEPKDVTPILVRAVDLIRAQALNNLRAAGIKTKTGTLERSLITRPSKSKRIAAAWTKAGGSVEGETGGEAISARHAHLIEFGHRIVGHKPNKKDTGKNTKDSPNASKAIGFFRRAVDTMRKASRDLISEGIVKLLWDSEK